MFRHLMKKTGDRWVLTSNSGRVISRRPQDVSITFNAEENTVSANVKLRAEYGGGATVGFGAVDNSTFGDNQNYAAATNKDLTSIQRGHGEDDVPATLAAGGIVSGSGPLCINCEFMRWGSWVVGIQYEDGDSDQSYTQTIASIGWWVAGDLPTVGELPLEGTATYEGTTVGTISQRIDEEWAAFPVPASGTVNMDWDFAQRAGHLEINDFKATGEGAPPALNMAGRMRIPGWLDDGSMNKFRGGLDGYLGEDAIHGVANGSFARNGDDPTAGVLGNWSARNSDFKANGVFGAAKTGFSPDGQLPPVFPTRHQRLRLISIRQMSKNIPASRSTRWPARLPCMAAS